MTPKWLWRTWDSNGLCLRWRGKPVYDHHLTVWMMPSDMPLTWAYDAKQDRKRGGPRSIRRIQYTKET